MKFMKFFFKIDDKVKNVFLRIDKFSKEIHCKHWSITKNKTLEIQANRWEDWQWIDGGLRWTRNRDHAGFQFEIQILGFYFHIWLCDNRHWDCKTKNWETYPEEEDLCPVCDSPRKRGKCLNEECTSHGKVLVNGQWCEPSDGFAKAIYETEQALKRKR